MSKGLEIRLASRPQGLPTMDNFEFVEVEAPQPGEGQLLVRNLVMSVDPYMRGRMNEGKSYVPPFEVGKALDGGAVGEVVSSNAEGFQSGDLVLHQLGWRDYAVVPAEHATKVDPNIAPPSAYLSVLGMPGMTAYAGLVDVAEQKEGDVVFVSGAAGAVGSLAGQIAKLRGAKKVIGSAGSAEKVKYLLDEVGFDAAFNYHDGPVREQLAHAAPEGIDVYFDNVGGEHLEAAIFCFNDYGRAAECGMISQYNNEKPEPGPRNMMMIVQKRLKVRGFIVMDHAHLKDQFFKEVGGWLSEGKISYRETVVEGLRNAPDAFLGLMRGDNTGKMLVKIA
ncbi:NADP-dependent oxidoreductase [Saccharopolyspora rhizosphaerae]|uniref:NADP-dependent oxidoreductase n=1 Tax=Saccharopolyspora rhizosphaerae TaxID=2492662 RepID=A0A426K4Y3_9PSEU|nr:NADP-dependent oxidoreductase [Saccharopolyspora rhizosphaerae]RRO20462.1 NADP-dependent oxidoreductase [Saccharopolyspora rhizosphaerae]